MIHETERLLELSAKVKNMSGHHVMSQISLLVQHDSYAEKKEHQVSA